jgi:hypothetical protein
LVFVRLYELVWYRYCVRKKLLVAISASTCASKHNTWQLLREELTRHDMPTRAKTACEVVFSYHLDIALIGYCVDRILRCYVRTCQ